MSQYRCFHLRAPFILRWTLLHTCWSRSENRVFFYALKFFMESQLLRFVPEGFWAIPQYHLLMQCQSKSCPPQYCCWPSYLFPTAWQIFTSIAAKVGVGTFPGYHTNRLRRYTNEPGIIVRNTYSYMPSKGSGVVKIWTVLHCRCCLYA